MTPLGIAITGCLAGILLGGGFVMALRERSLENAEGVSELGVIWAIAGAITLGALIGVVTS